MKTAYCYLLKKTPRQDDRGSQIVTRGTTRSQAIASALVLLSAKFDVLADFLTTLRLGRNATHARLGIVKCSDRVSHPVTPDIRSKFGEREARIQFHDRLAKVRARLSGPADAQIQVTDRNLERVRECLALWRLSCLEVGFEVHASMIDQFDLAEQIFLHVDQNDRRRYAGDDENL